MKKLYFLFFFVIGFLGNAQIVNFTDANFKAKLLSASPSNQIASTSSLVYNSMNGTWGVYSYNVIDSNNDGEIQVSEAQAIKWLDVSNSNISSIEEFKTKEIFFANIKDGLYFHFSKNTIVSLLTQTLSANCSCVKLFNILKSFIIVFIKLYFYK